jgi:hypothetical protein
VVSRSVWCASPVEGLYPLQVSAMAGGAAQLATFVVEV